MNNIVKQTDWHNQILRLLCLFMKKCVFENFSWDEKKYESIKWVHYSWHTENITCEVLGYSSIELRENIQNTHF